MLDVKYLYFVFHNLIAFLATAYLDLLLKNSARFMISNVDVKVEGVLIYYVTVDSLIGSESKDEEYENKFNNVRCFGREKVNLRRWRRFAS